MHTISKSNIKVERTDLSQVATPPRITFHIFGRQYCQLHVRPGPKPAMHTIDPKDAHSSGFSRQGENRSRDERGIS
jgi:hypothetical protein